MATLLENVDDISMTNIVCHCRTEQHITKIYHNWSIADFWVLEESVKNLLSAPIEGLYFNIEMTIQNINNNKQILFYSKNVEATSAIHHNYRVYVQAREEEEVLPTNWNKTCIKRDTKLYDIDIETLRMNKEEYVPNNTLTVCFQFEVFENIFHKSITEVSDMQQLSTDNLLLISGKADTLVAFIIDTDTEEKKVLRVNKHLLCWKSKVFGKMFATNLKESKINEVPIKDIKYDVFKHLVSYVETGDLFDLNINTDSNNTETIYDILAAASKYEMEDLMLMCEKHLIQCMTKHNVVAHLNVAILHNRRYLEEFALKFIKLHIKEMKYSRDFILLLQNNPMLVTKIKNQKLRTTQTCFSEYESNVSSSSISPEPADNEIP